MMGVPRREILIVDDCESDRQAIEQALRTDRSCRYHFHQAATGAQALEMVRQANGTIDLIILDWHLPDITGIEFARSLRGTSQIPPYPIVLLTTSGSPSIAQEALLAGVQDFFTKSMVHADILPLVTRNAMERFRLIQRLVRSERDAREAKVRAEDANRAKSIFLTSMSHELRTPLTAVLGLAELLLDDPHACDARQMLEMIQSNGQHLAELLNDILDLAKIEAGHSDIKLLPCEPLRIIYELCTLLRFRAADEGIDLRLEFHGALPAKITTDAVRLRQIMMNLISNAIKFTKGGTIDVIVSFEEKAYTQLLRFDVIDTGIGISRDNQQAIFQPFVQVGDKGNFRSGVGLGLAISRSLALALGGDLSVVSELGKGSTFTLTVRANEANTIGVMSPEYYQRNQSPPTGQSRPDDFDWHTRRILVAEDTRANQFLIRRMLEPSSVRLDFVDNGQRAVAEVIKESKGPMPYDLVLMDMQMPVQSGYDATRQLRALGMNVPIIALTAAAMEGDRERCLGAGCNNYLSKPIARKELFAAVSQVFHQSVAAH
ncbi:MAG: response regulator [Pirellulaceae bacterium]|nr:response regulator [Pirellulaceae bacterium]